MSRTSSLPTPRPLGSNVSVAWDRSPLSSGSIVPLVVVIAGGPPTPREPRFLGQLLGARAARSVQVWLDVNHCPNDRSVIPCQTLPRLSLSGHRSCTVDRRVPHRRAVHVDVWGCVGNDLVPQRTPAQADRSTPLTR
jgi:hypothetical protein